MIGQLRGHIIQSNPPEIILDVNGVGYEVIVPISDFALLPILPNAHNLTNHDANDTPVIAQLYIHTLVKEDVLQLYGFAELQTREFFRELIKISGIGGKMAILILSSMSVHEFCSHISTKNTSGLVKLPGVGKKTAERLILDLQDRIKPFINTNTSTAQTNIKISQSSSNTSTTAQAIAALTTLGYKTTEAQKMVDQINIENLSLEEVIKTALQFAR